MVSRADYSVYKLAPAVVAVYIDRQIVVGGNIMVCYVCMSRYAFLY